MSRGLRTVGILIALMISAGLLLTATEASPVGITASERASVVPVILDHGDLNREIDNFGREPTKLLQANGWRGLYARVEGYEVRDADVRAAVRARDGTGDTVFMVSADPPDPILLFAGIPAIPSGPVSHSTRINHPLDTGPDGRTVEEVELILGPRAYSIRHSAGNEWPCDAVVTLHHSDQSRELYPTGEPTLCDEPHFRIHWIGDLDGDGRLDLFATFSGKYSAHPRQLFLSRPSEDGLAVLVATYNPY